MTIPTNPAPGREWTNDVTGVKYRWDGDRWIIVDNTEDIDLSGYVTDAEFKTDQTRQDDHDDVQDDQINALETQIQLLAQTQAAGKWNYNRNISGGSVRPPASASFYATHQDGADRVLLNWADARLFMISKTDLDGKQFVFTEFEEGDKMEILATDGSSACYGTVTNQPTQEAYGNLVIAVERSNGGPSEGKEYILSVYRPGASGGDADLDVLDGRYVKKGGDLMTASLEVMDDSGRPAFIATRKSDGEPRLAIYTDGKLETQNLINVDMPNEDDVCLRVRKNGRNKIELTNKGYVKLPGGGLLFQHDDGAKKAYMYNASENITQWTAYNGTQLKITARDGDPGGGRTYIDIKTADSSGTAGEDTGYRMKLYHVADPTEELHGVNKRYVDQMSSMPTPARFKWEWVGKATDHPGDGLTAGQFSGPQLGQGTSSHGFFYYLNLKPMNSGYKIYSRPNDEEMSFPEANGGPLLSVWSDPVYNDSSVITLMCVQRIKRLKFVGTNYETDGGFIEIETHQGAGYSHTFAGTGLFYNSPYYIQLSGIF